MPASETAEQEFSSRLRGPEYGQPFENVFSGLDAGGLLDVIEPHSATAVISGRVHRPAGSAAHEAAPALTSATARTSLLGARPVSLAPSRSRTAVPESENAARDFFPAPRSEDGIL